MTQSVFLSFPPFLVCFRLCFLPLFSHFFVCFFIPFICLFLFLPILSLSHCFLFHHFLFPSYFYYFFFSLFIYVFLSPLVFLSLFQCSFRLPLPQFPSLSSCFFITFLRAYLLFIYLLLASYFLICFLFSLLLLFYLDSFFFFLPSRSDVSEWQITAGWF